MTYPQRNAARQAADFVSVIIPTHNRLQFLPDALDSVVAQDYRPLELIVVDDGSTDGTWDFLREYATAAASDGLSLHVARQPNAGAPSARNHGLRLSRGEFIQFLDSDDALGPGKIGLQVAALRADDSLAMMHGTIRWLGAHDAHMPYQNREMGLEESLRCCVTGECGFFCTPSPLFRRGTVEDMGPWDESLPCYQDVDYAFRFFSLGRPWGFCPEASCLLRPPDEVRDQISGKPTTPQAARRLANARLHLLTENWHGLPESFSTKRENRTLYARHLLLALRRALAQGGRPPGATLEVLAACAVDSGQARTVHTFQALTRLFGWRNGAFCHGLLERVYGRARRFVRRQRAE